MKSIPNVLIIIACLWFSPAQAVKIMDSTGQLTGATDISVNGLLYDVEFIDGTCIDLYNGCDNSLLDFPFHSISSANAASQALLDQVFIDDSTSLFDSNSSLTRGCIPNNFGQCSVYTPYAFDTSRVAVSVATNYSFSSFLPGLIDHTRATSVGRAEDLSTNRDSSFTVFAVWTPHIPVTPITLPGTLILLVSGILGMMTLKRRQVQ